MKLYGVAIAAVPRKDNANIIDVICNPIAVSDKNRRKFEVQNELAFKISFDSTNKKEIADCFIKITNTIESVVKLQQQTLAEHNLPYMPVALIVGQDSRTPTNGNALSIHLFGKRAFPPLTEEDIQMKLWNDIPLNRKIRQPSEITNEDKKFLKDLLSLGEPWSAHYDKMIKENIAQEIGIEEAQKNKEKFLIEGQTDSAEFTNACTKLPQLLEQCTLKWGNYTAPSPRIWDNLKQTRLDGELLELKEPFERGDSRAYLRLLDLAMNQGRIEAKKATLSEKRPFAIASPPGYTTDQAMQEKYPRFSFYYWDEAFEQVFHETYDKEYNGPFSSHMKLSLDPPSPPFTDPCMDMINDQHQIIMGQRNVNNVDDKYVWRKKIATFAQEYVENSGKNKSTDSHSWGARVSKSEQINHKQL